MHACTNVMLVSKYIYVYMCMRVYLTHIYRYVYTGTYIRMYIVCLSMNRGYQHGILYSRTVWECHAFPIPLKRLAGSLGRNAVTKRPAQHNNTRIEGEEVCSKCIPNMCRFQYGDATCDKVTSKTSAQSVCKRA